MLRATFRGNQRNDLSNRLGLSREFELHDHTFDRAGLRGFRDNRSHLVSDLSLSTGLSSLRVSSRVLILGFDE